MDSHFVAHLLDHFKWIILERVGIWLIPILLGSILSALALFFLLGQTLNTRNHITFSQKGIGSSSKPLDTLDVQKCPSAAITFLLITFFGSFGLFYLSPIIGLLMSVITLASSITIFWSLHIFMISQILIWIASYITGVILLVRFRKGLWYRHH